MDSSRDADLAKLYEIFSDFKQPKRTRTLAHRSYQSIQRQIKDKKLATMRSRLIRAVQADDNHVIEKIEQLIYDYSLRQGYSRA